MKKLLTIFVCLLSTFGLITQVNAAKKEETETVTTTQKATNKVNVYIFTKESCPYCEKAKTFFEELAEDEEYGQMFQVVEYQVWDSSWAEDENNSKIMNAVAGYFEEEIGGAPYIVIGKTYSFNGFSESYEDTLKSEVKKAYEDEEYYDLVSAVIANDGELPKDLEESSVLGTIIGTSIVVLVIGGFTLLVIFSRKEN